MNATSVRCPTAAATADAGRRLAPVLRRGDLVLLEGELGAGKTTFTQGLVAALGVDGPVTSPTFTLVNQYRTRGGLVLLHVDLYRIDRRVEVEDLALGEMLDDGAVAIVEWGSRAAGALDWDRLEVTITEEHSGSRTINFTPVGTSWEQRCP